MYCSIVHFLSAVVAASLFKGISAISKDDFLVNDLPELPKNLSHYKTYAGVLPSKNNVNNQVFFWLAECNMETSNDAPVVIWLNGGPGCSSSTGMLLEIGPFRITTEGKLKENVETWNHFAHILYVDQPAYTGFSYSKTGNYTTTFSELQENFRGFLDSFFEIFPTLKQKQIYFAGESYAGVYIPYIAHDLIQNSQYHISGMIIGNGWIGAKTMYASYEKFLEKENLMPSAEYKDKINNLTKACIKKYDNSSLIDFASREECEAIANVYLEYSKLNGKQCVNVYNVDLRDEKPEDQCGLFWPPEERPFTTYMNRGDVRKALHVPNEYSASWKECNSQVGSYLLTPISSEVYIPNLLEKMRLLLFNGDRDFLCNYIGTQDYVDSLKGKDDTHVMKDASRVSWMLNGNNVGTIQESGNLIYVILKNASHMSTYDQTGTTQIMFKNFIMSSHPHISFTSLVGGNDANNDTSLNQDLHRRSLWIALFGIFIFIILGILYVLYKKGIICKKGFPFNYRSLSEESLQMDEFEHERGLPNGSTNWMHNKTELFSVDHDMLDLDSQGIYEQDHFYDDPMEQSIRYSGPPSRKHSSHKYSEDIIEVIEEFPF